jgi:hypothetical protein
VERLQLQHKAPNGSSAAPAKNNAARASELPRDFTHLHLLSASRQLPLATTTPAVRQRVMAARRPVPTRAADDSINGVPGGGPSCPNALQISRSGERPGLRGPDASHCGSSQSRADDCARIPGQERDRIWYRPRHGSCRSCDASDRRLPSRTMIDARARGNRR